MSESKSIKKAHVAQRKMKLEVWSKHERKWNLDKLIDDKGHQMHSIVQNQLNSIDKIIDQTSQCDKTRH